MVGLGKIAYTISEDTTKELQKNLSVGLFRHLHKYLIEDIQAEQNKSYLYRYILDLDRTK